jgi:hypothetical protein
MERGGLSQSLARLLQRRLKLAAAAPLQDASGVPPRLQGTGSPCSPEAGNPWHACYKLRRHLQKMG